MKNRHRRPLIIGAGTLATIGALALVALALPAGALVNGSRQPSSATQPRPVATVTGRGVDGAATLSAGPLSAPGAGLVLVALVASDGRAAGQSVTKVTGGGLTWSRVVSGSGSAGAVEIWFAVSRQPVAHFTVTATRARSGYHGQLTVTALAGADLDAPVDSTAHASAASGAAAVSLTPQTPGSLILGTGNDYDVAAEPRPLDQVRAMGSFADRSTGDTYWSAYRSSKSAGGQTTVGVAAPSNGRWNAVAIAVRPPRTGAASPTASPVTASTSPAPVPPTPSSSPTAGGKSPSPTAPSSAAGWPSAANTGVPAGTQLTASGPLHVTTPGTVLANLDISGSVMVDAPGVVIKNSRIHGSDIFGVRVLSGDVKIYDSELSGFSEAAIIFDNWSAYRVNIHGVGSDGAKLGSNTLLQDSYLHDFTPTPGSHADGAQLQSGEKNITVRHNTITPGNVNSALFFAPDLGPNGAGPVVIDNNLLGDGNWTVYIVDGNNGQYHQNGYQVTNNRFQHTATYGPLDVNEPGSCFTVWSGNVYADNGQVLNGP